jgi:mono/diheme cytochrome c family protein
LLTGCDLPGRPDPAKRPVPADKVMDFSTLYGQNCAGCHGADGKLGAAPPLNDPLFRGIITESELENVVAKGRKNTLMPAFAKESGGTLTAAQIQVLVKEIKGIAYKVVQKQSSNAVAIDVMDDAGGISPKWGTPEKPPSGVPSYQDPAPNDSAGAKDKGALAFARACAVCHGNDGKGVAKGGETIRAINDPVFLALLSNQALRRVVITGRPDLRMPNYAQARPDQAHFTPLTNEEVTDLVALLASWRREK